MGNYSRLANLIASHPEMALFRQFASLNVKNILYMQAELVHLEAELENIEREDKHSKNGDKFEVSLFDLKASSCTENDIQWRKVLEIRSKLQQYSAALLQYSSIQKYEKPHKRHLNILREWLDRPEGGDFFLRGREAETWKTDADLIALSTRKAEKDVLTRLISERVIPWYHRYWGHRFKVLFSSSSSITLAENVPWSTQKDEDFNGVWHYEDATFVAVVNVISIVLSSLLPTTSILVLYGIHKPGVRLAVIMVFTALFSLTLTTVAKAKRIDIFAATTA
ncbi:hypothetical protein MMC07_001598 [Pseudocyphellaria aurata]|nr:hypothetical protein [Pseudocyphellaria aurata]